MRERLLLLFFVLIGLLQMQAQEATSAFKSGKIGFTFSSFGGNDVVQDDGHIGDYAFKGDYFHTFGISYSFPFTKWLDFETGLKYDFPSRISVIANPYLKKHSLIAFSAENYRGPVAESGIRVGITYNQGKGK